MCVLGLGDMMMSEHKRETIRETHAAQVGARALSQLSSAARSNALERVADALVAKL